MKAPSINLRNKNFLLSFSPCTPAAYTQENPEEKTVLSLLLVTYYYFFVYLFPFLFYLLNTCN